MILGDTWWWWFVPGALWSEQFITNHCQCLSLSSATPVLARGNGLSNTRLHGSGFLSNVSNPSPPMLTSSLSHGSAARQGHLFRQTRIFFRSRGWGDLLDTTDLQTHGTVCHATACHSYYFQPKSRQFCTGLVQALLPAYPTALFFLNATG